MKKKLLCTGSFLILTGLLTLTANGQQLGFDRQVSSPAGPQTEAPDMVIAPGGPIFNAHRSGNDIIVKVSADGGKTWSVWETLSEKGYTFSAPALAVTGQGTKLLVAGIRKSTQGKSQAVFIRQYDAATGACTGQPLLQPLPGEVYSCALAAAGNADGDREGIAIAYAFRSGLQCDLVQQVSADGGNSFPLTFRVAGSKGYIRHISMAYGKSTTASNGRFFLAWDEYATPSAAWGKVYTAHSTSTILSATIAPVRIDNLQTATEHRMASPVIAVSSTGDNDSSSCTAVILATCRQEGNTDGATSIASFTNYRGHYTNYWQYAPLAAAGSSPAIAFDPVNNRFAASYYNTGDKNMRLLQAGYDNPAAWQEQAAAYADQAEASDPGACIAADPATGLMALSWAGTSGIRFDAENNREATEISTIAVSHKDNGNTLTWQAGGTDDEGMVTVERSADGITFVTLSQAAQQAAPIGNTYVDGQPLAGINYYRIKAGNHYSPIVSAYADEPIEGTIRLYPNPAVTTLQVITAHAADGAMLTVYSIDGKRCSQVPASGNLTVVDISKLPAGAYLLQYDNGTEKKNARFTKVML